MVSQVPVDEPAVDDAFSAAIELARHQGALAWELRATTSFARERLRRGGRARDILRDVAAVYARFNEGLETPDLRLARDLLEQRVGR